jgi:hypothetical protein
VPADDVGDPISEFAEGRSGGKAKRDRRICEDHAQPRFACVRMMMRLHVALHSSVVYEVTVSAASRRGQDRKLLHRLSDQCGCADANNLKHHIVASGRPERTVATTHIERTHRGRSREVTAAANGAAPAKPNRAFSGRIFDRF